MRESWWGCGPARPLLDQFIQRHHFERFVLTRRLVCFLERDQLDLDILHRDFRIPQRNQLDF
jgi:hypothetical protein